MSYYVSCSLLIICTEQIAYIAVILMSILMSTFFNYLKFLIIKFMLKWDHSFFSARKELNSEQLIRADL